MVFSLHEANQYIKDNWERDYKNEIAKGNYMLLAKYNGHYRTYSDIPSLVKAHELKNILEGYASVLNKNGMEVPQDHKIFYIICPKIDFELK